MGGRDLGRAGVPGGEKRSGERVGGGGGGREEKRSGEGAVPAPSAPAARGREEKGEEIGGGKRSGERRERKAQPSAARWD